MKYWLSILILALFLTPAARIWGLNGLALQLTAYSTDGANTGTARLTATVTFHGFVTGTTGTGTAGTAVVWSVQGAGTISNSGIYQAPQTMPANPQVKVTAVLQGNPTVSASYTMSLLNTLPVVYNAYVANGNLLAAAVNTVTIHGAGFMPGSFARINSIAVPTTYQSSGYLLAQVAVPAAAPGMLQLTVSNPSPGGGTTAVFSLAVVRPKLVLTAYDSDGANTGTARIGGSVTVDSWVTGAANTGVVWTLTGAGSLSTGGFYQAPAIMPANPSVNIVATLLEDSSVAASYGFNLINDAPTIYNAYVLNGGLLSATTNTVTIHGAGFIASSTVLIGGVAVPTTYQSAGYLLAQVAVPAGATGTMQLQVQTPAPGGGTTQVFNLPIAKIWLDLTALANSGLDPVSLPVGAAIAFSSQIQGSGAAVALPVVWMVSGAGSISSTGLYQAPDSMPQSAGVNVNAALVANPSVTATYHFYLVGAAPVITGSNPAQLAPGQMNTVTVYGQNFVWGTYLTCNGVVLPVSEGTNSSLQTTITVPAGQISPLSLVAHNPDMNVAASASFGIAVGSPEGTLAVAVGLVPGTEIAQDFLGLSHEWTDPVWLMGDSALGVNGAYRQLLRNLTLGADYPLSIRMGGGSSDASGEPSAALGATLAQLANTLPVHYLLGINLGSDNLGLATAQASFFLKTLPAGSVQALEIGNEPDEYAWNGMRNSSYGVTSYLSDFAKWQTALAPLHSSTVTLMGPSWGQTSSLRSGFSAFEAQESAQVGVVSQHVYAGYQETQSYFPPDFLLSPASSQAGPASVAAAVAQAHAAHQLFRIGEMNSIDGGGIEGISDSFGAALWSIDTMFRYASVGVDGVNWHGLSGCVYCPFTFAVQNSASGGNTYTLTHANPLYYGWLFFENAASNGSRLLQVTVPSNPNVSVWATLDRSGVVRVTIVNKDKLFGGTVEVSVSGYGDGTSVQLLAPAYTSTSAVTLAGQTFDGAGGGVIQGAAATHTIVPVNGIYGVAVPPVSATLLTLSH